MSNIPLPNKIYFTKEDASHAEVVIEPLYRGYGVTIGNALRRVLLSSLPGAAVTAIKIKGVDHEFSTVQNVPEDVVDIILNLKQLRLKLHSDEPVLLELRAKGQKEITAGMIKPDSRVQIINQDLVIATLDSKTAEFSMDIIVASGMGYVPVEMREGEKLETGMIAIDAIFTPVRNVNFQVQNVRVGQITNFDKLTLTMETDGTISGREALDMASQILVDHYALLNTSKMDEPAAIPEDAEALPQASAAEEPSFAAPAEEEKEDIRELALSNRAQNALLRNSIRSIAKLKSLAPDALSHMEGLGEKSVEEIKAALEKYEASS